MLSGMGHWGFLRAVQWEVDRSGVGTAGFSRVKLSFSKTTSAPFNTICQECLMIKLTGIIKLMYVSRFEDKTVLLGSRLLGALLLIGQNGVEQTSQQLHTLWIRSSYHPSAI